MEVLTTYLPQDRCHALARGAALPDRCHGAALFADISGFTPLSENLARSLGPRRGAEELTVHLNAVYDALIHEVDRQGGSVIAFAGDAITCWFDGDDGWRAVASALAMQRAMARFAVVPLADGTCVALAVKTSVATGPARRFVAGDPAIRLLDVLAGHTLARMAAAAGETRKGELVLDAATVEPLGDGLAVAEWRTDAAGRRFAVVTSARPEAAGQAVVPPPDLDDALTRPWLAAGVYERLQAGQGEFLTELRPAVALFVKFDGIDYDADPAAGDKLNGFVSWIERLLVPFEGCLLDLNVGDKGSYLYCTFGAPIAHEDDSQRALYVAQQIRQAPARFPFITTVQLGVNPGTMRTGAYGSTTRRTYGVLGDDVNFAARLMEKALPGQVLVSGRLQAACARDFAWEAQPPLKAKGKTTTLPVFALLEGDAARSEGVANAAPDSPMVGRAAELRQIEEAIRRARAGRGQIVGITAEAGMGKSRLVLEALGRAREQGFEAFVGQCQSYGTNTSYLAWWDIWQRFFGVDPRDAVDGVTGRLESQLAGYGAALAPRLPLLGSVLNLPLPDNDLTRHFDAKLRKASLEALLVECLQRRAAQGPIVLVLEDSHWLDPLSRDLLEVVARGLAAVPLLVLLAYRPPESPAQRTLDLQGLPHFVELPLTELPRAEAEQLLLLRLGELFGHSVQPSLSGVERLLARAQGNPFYIEELLRLLQDQGVDPGRTEALEQLELPNSLHSLILSRIDRLLESQRITLKVASVIGRLFPAAALWGINARLPELQVRADLASLARLELTVEDQPEPALVYLFRHVVTQEVAYESLAYGTRAALHNEIGLYLEAQGPEAVARQIDLLAFHFDRGENAAKRRHYLLRAGEAAQARYANAAAISYYQRALPLLEAAEQVPVRLKLGRVLELVGNWAEASRNHDAALAIATRLGDLRAQAAVHAARGELHRKRGQYAEATACLGRARGLYHEAKDDAGIAEVFHFLGSVAGQQGNYDEAFGLYRQSLEIRRRLDDKTGIASLFSNLGIISWFSGHFDEARAYYESALVIRREAGDRWAIANSLNNLGLVLRDLGEIAEARSLLEQALRIGREIGDRWSIANTLSSLGDVTLSQNDLAAAREVLLESLTISRELNDRQGLAFLLEYFAVLAAKRRRPETAETLVGAASALRAALGAPLSPTEQARLDASLAEASAQLDAPARDALRQAGRELGEDRAMDLAIASGAD